MNDEKLRALAARVDLLRREADAVVSETDDFPALKANADRILASVRMMAINLEPYADPGPAVVE